ncbi:MAG TPA: ubiquitin-like protein Pup [Candidatus Saccharimonadales bacterium]|nr:ubiquitin-like protein Pup [Candidatus Saccharimonadales bacterium]
MRAEQFRFAHLNTGYERDAMRVRGDAIDILAGVHQAASQQRKSKPAPQRQAQEESAQESAVATTTRGDELKADLDGLLDEIDSVLEENAEEFVRSYVQKGGE